MTVSELSEGVYWFRAESQGKLKHFFILYSLNQRGFIKVFLIFIQINIETKKDIGMQIFLFIVIDIIVFLVLYLGFNINWIIACVISTSLTWAGFYLFYYLVGYRPA